MERCARVLKQHDALHIGVAVILVLLALGLALVAALMLYALVTRRYETSD